MYSWQTRNKTDKERYLEDELEREREWRRQEQNQREQERRARREEMRQRIEDSYRQATTWPEALQNQAHLFGREAGDNYGWIDENGEEQDAFKDDFFGPGASACQRALELWPEAEAAVAEEISALEAKIAELRKSVALRVADRLDEENTADIAGVRHVANALRTTDEEPGALGNWLYW